MHIRMADLADGDAIAALLTDLGYPVETSCLAQSLQRQLDHPDARLLVAEQAGCVVGVISLHFIPQLALPGDFCRISYLCVSPGARGNGIGAALEARAGAPFTLARATPNHPNMCSNGFPRAQELGPHKPRPGPLHAGHLDPQ